MKILQSIYYTSAGERTLLGGDQNSSDLAHSHHLTFPNAGCRQRLGGRVGEMWVRNRGAPSFGCANEKRSLAGASIEEKNYSKHLCFYLF